MALQDKHAAGMTLIELMIVVAIVGILAMIAGPAWNDQVIKSRRADARNTLLAAQIEQEPACRRLLWNELLNLVRASGNWGFMMQPKDDPSRDMVLLLQRAAT